MGYAQRSTFTFSEDDSLPTPGYTLPGDRRSLGSLLLHVLLRVFSLVGKGFAWLALLGLLHSVPLWLGILTGQWLLRRLLSYLLGGMQFSLLAMLLQALRALGRILVIGAAITWRYWPRFTLKPPWSYLALGFYGALWLYAEVLALSSWGH